MSARLEDTAHLGQTARLVAVRKVLEDVQAKHAIEGGRRERQIEHGCLSHTFGCVIGIDTLDCEAPRVLVDEHALATAAIEHAAARGQAIELRAHPPQLGGVGRGVLPALVRRAVVIAAQGVLAPSQPGRIRHRA